MFLSLFVSLTFASIDEQQQRLVDECQAAALAASPQQRLHEYVLGEQPVLQLTAAADMAAVDQTMALALL